MTTTLDPEVEVEEDDDEALIATQRAPGPLVVEPRRLIGMVLSDRYRLLDLLGQGGMGAVYLAEHVVIGKRVAVKVLSPEYSRNPGDVQRFLQEARMASVVRHDHVVDITDFGYTPRGQAFLVMELLEGEDLASLLQREGRLPWLRATELALQIAAGLSAAHAKGVVHRDMKPENCFLVKRPAGDDFVKVLDFGIAKITDERLKLTGDSLTIEGGVIGTPEYIAPEIARGKKADARVDIYALGVVLYRMLTGSLPFTSASGNYMEVLSAHITEAPEAPRQRAPDAQIPPQLEVVVLRALEKDPETRYLSVDAFATAIREVQVLLTGASSTGLIDLPRLRPRRRPVSSPWSRVRTAAVALAAAVAGGLLVALLLRQEPVSEQILVVPEDDPPPGKTPEPLPSPIPPTPPTPPPPPPALTEPDEPADEPRKPGLTEAQFRRIVDEIEASLRSKCTGMPGMSIRVRISVRPDGSVDRVSAEGAQAGTSFGLCVVRQVRAARFPRATRPTTRSATLKL